MNPSDFYSTGFSIASTHRGSLEVSPIKTPHRRFLPTVFKTGFLTDMIA